MARDVRDDTIKVPLARPPSWAPAWGEKYPGTHSLRILDVGDLLAVEGAALARADVTADPALDVTVIVVDDCVVRLRVGGGVAGAKHPIRLLLTFDNGYEDEVVAWQPIRQPAPVGLLPAVQAVILDLRDFGWMADGRDQTAVMQRALAAVPAQGGAIRIPGCSAGTTLGEISIDKMVTVFGEGGPAGQTVIRPLTPTTTVFTVAAPFCTISDLAFSPVSPGQQKQTAGAYVRVTAAAARFRARELTFTEFHEGLFIDGQVPSVSASGLRGYLYSTGLSQSAAFLHIRGGLDLRFDDMTANGPGTGTADVLTGIWVEACGDATISRSDIIAMGTDLLVAPGPGQEVDSLWLDGVFLDTAVRGAMWATQGGVIRRSRMAGCWASSHQLEGVRIEADIDGLDIDAPHIFGNGGAGLAIVRGTNIRARGGQIAGNGGDGVAVAAGCSDWSIDGTTVGASGGFPGNTGFGVRVAPGASDRFRVADLAGLCSNVGGSVWDGGTGLDRVLRGVPAACPASSPSAPVNDNNPGPALVAAVI